MMLLHSTAPSSTSGAHPHPHQCLPNVKLMVKMPPSELEGLLIFLASLVYTGSAGVHIR